MTVRGFINGHPTFVVSVTQANYRGFSNAKDAIVVSLTVTPLSWFR